MLSAKSNTTIRIKVLETHMEANSKMQYFISTLKKRFSFSNDQSMKEAEELSSLTIAHFEVFWVLKF